MTNAHRWQSQVLDCKQGFGYQIAHLLAHALLKDRHQYFFNQLVATGVRLQYPLKLFWCKASFFELPNTTFNIV